MFCLHFLITHKTGHPENPTSTGRHLTLHLYIFSFIRDQLFIKLENFEIDVQELFWASIYAPFGHITAIRKTRTRHQITTCMIWV